MFAVPRISNVTSRDRSKTDLQYKLFYMKYDLLIFGASQVHVSPEFLCLQ
jgi:hypothetical protein